MNGETDDGVIIAILLAREMIKSGLLVVTYDIKAMAFISAGNDDFVGDQFEGSSSPGDPCSKALGGLLLLGVLSNWKTVWF